MNFKLLFQYSLLFLLSFHSFGMEQLSGNKELIKQAVEEALHEQLKSQQEQIQQITESLSKKEVNQNELLDTLLYPFSYLLPSKTQLVLTAIVVGGIGGLKYFLSTRATVDDLVKAHQETMGEFDKKKKAYQSVKNQNRVRFEEKKKAVSEALDNADIEVVKLGTAFDELMKIELESEKGYQDKFDQTSKSILDRIKLFQDKKKVRMTDLSAILLNHVKQSRANIGLISSDIKGFQEQFDNNMDAHKQNFSNQMRQFSIDDAEKIFTQTYEEIMQNSQKVLNEGDTALQENELFRKKSNTEFEKSSNNFHKVQETLKKNWEDSTKEIANGLGLSQLLAKKIEALCQASENESKEKKTKIIAGPSVGALPEISQKKLLEQKTHVQQLEFNAAAQ